MIGSPRRMVKRRIGPGSVGVLACDVVGRRVKGERDAGTATGLARRRCLASAAGSGPASRRRGRRSGPLTRLGESTLSGRVRRSSRRIGGQVPGRREHSFRSSHPTAEPCLPARAGVRGLVPGSGLRHAAGVVSRARACHSAARAEATSAAMRRNSARRAVWTRRAASRSVSAAAAASSSAKSMPGLRCCAASGRARNLA